MKAGNNSTDTSLDVQASLATLASQRDISVADLEAVFRTVLDDKRKAQAQAIEEMKTALRQLFADSVEEFGQDVAFEATGEVLAGFKYTLTRRRWALLNGSRKRWWRVLVFGKGTVAK